VKSSTWLCPVALLALAACPGPDQGLPVAPPPPPPEAPSIVLNTSAVTFEQTVGGAEPVPVDVGVSQSGTGSLGTLGVTVAYATSADWLSATMSAPTAPGVLTLRITPNPGIGTYTATVTVSSSNGAVEARSITVTLVVRQVAAPEAPVDLRATATSPTKVLLTWSNQSSNVTRFEVQRCTGAGCTSFGASPWPVWDPNASSYLDAVARQSTSFTYRVRAVNAGGYSPWSNLAFVTTPIAPPQAPLSLTATAVSSGRIDLSWTVPSGNNETGYIIERCIGSGCTSFADHDRTGAGVPGYQDVGLDIGTTYTYRVRAENSAGFSGYSAVKSAKTFAAREPSDLRVTGRTANLIELTWTDNSSNESVFHVEVCSGTPEVCSIRVAGSTATFIVTGLNPSTQYQFQVKAIAVTGGGSGWSNRIAGITLDVPPTAPSNLTAAAVSPGKINLSWKDNSSNEGRFYIESCVAVIVTGLPACNNGWQQLGQTDANVTTHAATGLAAGTTYLFRVRAWNSAGYSSYSNTFSARTLSIIPGS